MWYLTHTCTGWCFEPIRKNVCVSVCHLNLDESHESPHTKRILKIPKALTSWWSGSASPVAGISCAYPCHMGGHCTLNPSQSPLSSGKIVCKHKGWMISLASSIVCLAPNTSEEVHHCCCWYFFIVALSMDQVTSLTQLMNQHEPTQPQLVGGHLMRFIRVDKITFQHFKPSTRLELWHPHFVSLSFLSHSVCSKLPLSTSPVAP